MINNNRDKIWWVFLFIFMHVIAFGATTFSETEQEIHQEIATFGEQTQAIISQCTIISKTNVCRATYQYKVIFSEQTVKYTNTEKVDCNRCTKGETVTIKYLPQNPAKAEMVGNDRSAFDRAWSILFIIIAWAIPFFFAINNVIDFTKKRILTQDLLSLSIIIVSLSFILGSFLGILLSVFYFRNITNETDFIANSGFIILLLFILSIFLFSSFGHKALFLTLIGMSIMYILSFLLNFSLRSFIDGIAQSLWELANFLPLSCIWPLCFGMFGGLMGSWLIMAALHEKRREREKKTHHNDNKL